MTLLLQALPLLLLLLLLLSGLTGPLVAVLAALATAVPTVLLSLPADIDGTGFLVAEALRGFFLAAQPIGVVVGGLLFHAALSGTTDRAENAPPEPRRIFVATVLMGTFIESVTGFAVGAVFALTSLRGMGLAGAPAGALALLALGLVPWGGLGIGVLVGSALLDVEVQELSRMTAYPSAVWLMLLGPVHWRLCAAAGVAIPGREKAAQMMLLGTMGTILLAGHPWFPFEVLGILAAGLPLLWTLWWLAPPRDRVSWRRAAIGMAPYVFLTVALLAARAIPNPPMFRPWPNLPGFPVTHVAVVLGLVAGALLARRPRPLPLVSGALKRAARPAVVLMLYVVLARWLAGSGATAALAQAAAESLGRFAPFAVPPLGLTAGIITGSNVGANASLMAVQYQLGLSSGLPPLLTPGLHSFAGAAGAGMSFAATSLVCGLLADGTRPVHLWRLLLPSIIGVVVVGWVILLVMN